jgi:hypothetical protein
MTPSTHSGDAETDAVRLSTGERVGLPLRTRAETAGAAFPTSREGAAELLPDGLAPIPGGRDRAAVAFVCVDYERVGSGEIAPYDEFGVVVPATPDRGAESRTGRRRFLSALTGGVGGYVWYLPVTTEPARALGEEIWSYPKALADASVERDGRSWQTTVTVDGDHLVTLDVRAPPRTGWSQSARSYTVEDGTLLCQPLELTGEMGAWPLGGRASYELGDHPRADRPRQLDLGTRPLGRFGADAEFVVHASEIVHRPSDGG